MGHFVSFLEKMLKTDPLRRPADKPVSFDLFMIWESLKFPGSRGDLFGLMLLLAQITAVCLATDGTHGIDVQ